MIDFICEFMVGCLEGIYIVIIEFLAKILHFLKDRITGILSTQEKKILKQIHDQKPVVLFITNYVTATDCANIALAFGGSPIMADEEDEMEEMTNIADALVLNIGTINNRTLKSMLIAGKTANKKHIPVILDPCGVGATQFRKDAILSLLKEIKIDVLKGNAGEISSVCELCGVNVKHNTDKTKQSKSQGVDDNFNGTQELLINEAQQLSKYLNCVVCITGKVDYIISTDNIIDLHYGNKIMSKITGTGCMLNGVIACCCAVNNDYGVATKLACKIFGKKYYKLLQNHIKVAKAFNNI